VSSCVTKATEVARRLPRAGVALPVLFLGDHGIKQQKKKLKKVEVRNAKEKPGGLVEARP
jgi:hypothetical protein